MYKVFSILILIVSLVSGVVSLPFSVAFDKGPDTSDPEDVTRAQQVQEAAGISHTMVGNMDKVLKSNDPKHKQIVKDAFGPTPDTAKIQSAVDKLNTQTFKISDTKPSPQADPRFVASVPIGKTTGQPKSAKLGAEFFAPSSTPDFRAGTLIHEATHQMALTGDKVGHDNNIIKSGVPQDASSVQQKDGRPLTGYQFKETDPKGIPKTAGDLTDRYKGVVGGAANSHDNADSYRVFAHMCSQPGVLRRDILLFRRALLYADGDDHKYLARRNSCSLPPDYFKKKAAAKKATPAAAKSKTATKSPNGSTKALKTGALTSKTGLKGTKGAASAIRKTAPGAKGALPKGTKSAPPARTLKAKSGALGGKAVLGAKTAKSAKPLRGATGGAASVRAKAAGSPARGAKAATKGAAARAKTAVPNKAKAQPGRTLKATNGAKSALGAKGRTAKNGSAGALPKTAANPARGAKATTKGAKATAKPAKAPASNKAAGRTAAGSLKATKASPQAAVPKTQPGVAKPKGAKTGRK